MGFVENDAIPFHRVKNRLLVVDETVRAEHDVYLLEILDVSRTTGSVINESRETWGKFGNLCTPLSNDGFGHDDQRVRLGVFEHCRDDLDSLANPHLIAQESTLGTRGLMFHIIHPFYTVDLVGSVKSTVEGVLVHCCIGMKMIYSIFDLGVINYYDNHRRDQTLSHKRVPFLLKRVSFSP